MNIIPQDHILLNSAYEVANICKPLTEHFGVTFFSFVRTFRDNSRLHLTNHISSAEYFYKNYHRYRQQSTVQTDCTYSSGHLLCNNLPEAEKLIYAEVREHFNLDHILMIIDENINFRDFYFIGTNSENYKIVSLYLSHLDLIYRFIDYFKEVAKSLIIEANKNKIILPNYTKTAASELTFPPKTIAAFNQSILIEKGDNEIFSRQLNDLVDEQPPLHVLHKHLQIPIHFSPQQNRCLSSLLEGKSMKAIAAEMQLSTRTVEHYIEKIRRLLGCNSTKEVISSYYQALSATNCMEQK